MNYVIVLGYLIAAAINITPSVGVLSNDWLHMLYGLSDVDSDLSLLLRHRAVLFFIVGVLLVAGAFNERLRIIAGTAGLVSMCSFMVLYWRIPGTSDELQRVMVADLFGVVALLVAMATHITHIGKATNSASLRE